MTIFYVLDTGGLVLSSHLPSPTSQPGAPVPLILLST